MIEKYGLFDSVDSDERLYAEADMAILVKALGPDGVRGGEGALKISPAAKGLGVKVASGMAIVQGRYYALEDDGSGDKTIALNAAASSTRIDRIVLTLTYADRTIRLGVLRGTEAASPAAPALIRNAEKYMLSLAQVKVGVGVSAVTQADITDERQDQALCGLHIKSASEAMAAVDGKAPVAHAAAETTYGAGSATLYGHVRLSDAVDSSSKAGAGVAATPYAAASAYSRANNAYSLAQSKAAISRMYAVLRAANWTDTAPYTQVISDAGFFSSDCIVVDLDARNMKTDTAEVLLEAYAALDRVESQSGGCAVYCYREKPTVDIPLYLLVVRAN